MDSAAIRDQIDRIQRSEALAGKTQLIKLLEVLYGHVGSQAMLKPDRVIRELWPDEIKTKRSADVATEINRLRKVLDCYYRGDGANDPILISLPNRSPAAANGTREKRWIVAEPRGLEQKAAASPIRRAAFSRRLKIVTAIAAIAALSVVGYWLFRRFVVVDQPQSARLDGSTLVVMDAAGKDLWRQAFPDGFLPDYYGRGVLQHMWFGDLDGDGHTEVLFLYYPAGTWASHSTTLICYSDKGIEKWRWHPGRKLPELGVNPAIFGTVGLAVLKAPPGKPRRVVVASIHLPYYPTQIALLDSSGNTLSEYWHSGHLFHLVVADLDGDGREEILASGISNGYRQATLVVLDPDKVFGASVEHARPEIQIHGMGVPQERVRLLFPRSDMNKALLMYNRALEPAVNHGSTVISVEECKEDEHCEVFYQFDKNFHLLSAKAEDYFRNAHLEFYLHNSPAHSFSDEEDKEFQKVRCLTGCDSDYVTLRIR